MRKAHVKPRPPVLQRLRLQPRPWLLASLWRHEAVSMDRLRRVRILRLHFQCRIESMSPGHSLKQLALAQLPEIIQDLSACRPLGTSSVSRKLRRRRKKLSQALRPAAQRMNAWPDHRTNQERRSRSHSTLRVLASQKELLRLTR